MNQKAYSILFCALLASSFAHEFRAKAAAHPSFAAKVLERAAEPSDSSQVCEIQCNHTYSSNTTVSGNGHLIIKVNVTAGLFVAVNVNASAAVIIDVSSSTVVILNGTNGAAIVLYLNKGTGVYISTGAWLASKTSIQEFLRSFSVTVLIKISGAVPFKVSTASTTIMKEVNGVMALLVSISIAAEFQYNIKLGLQVVIAFGNQFILLLNGSLKGFLELVGTKEINLKYGLTEFLNLMEGLALIFGKITGGLLAAKVSIDLAAIALATHGAEVLFIIILALLAAKIDIGTALGGVLNNPETLFALIVHLGGGSNDGLNGLFKVVATIVAFINGNMALELVITALIQFLAENDQDLSEAFNSTLNLFLEVAIKVGGNGLEGLKTILKELIAGTYIFKGVHISAIIKILLSGIVQAKARLLRVLVAVILKLTAIVAASVALPLLLFVMIVHLNTRIGIELIKKITTIEIKIGAVSGSILLAALKSVPNILSLLKGDSYKLLISWPVIGELIEKVGEAISACSNGEFSVKHLINEWFVTSFKGLCQWMISIPLAVSSTTITNIKRIVTDCTSPSVYWGFSFSVKYS